jgi:hypothetical protein
MFQACLNLNLFWEFDWFSSFPLCSCWVFMKVKPWLLPFIFILIHQSYHLTVYIPRYWLHQKISHKNLIHLITTVVYATTQMFLLSGHSGSVPQWSTMIHVWLVVDDWDKISFPESANTFSLAVISQPVIHTHTVSLISAVGMLSQLWTWILAWLCGLKIFWEICKAITVMGTM